MISKYIRLLGLDSRQLYSELGMIKPNGIVRKDLHPLEDLVDAFAICFTNVMDQYPLPKPKPKPKRRRKQISKTSKSKNRKKSKIDNISTTIDV